MRFSSLSQCTRLPPMWSGFDSRTRRHVWVEFVVGARPCSERFFSVYSGFPLSSKTNIWKVSPISAIYFIFFYYYYVIVLKTPFTHVRFHWFPLSAHKCNFNSLVFSIDIVTSSFSKTSAFVPTSFSVPSLVLPLRTVLFFPRFRRPVKNYGNLRFCIIPALVKLSKSFIFGAFSIVFSFVHV